MPDFNVTICKDDLPFTWPMGYGCVLTGFLPDINGFMFKAVPDHLVKDAGHVVTPEEWASFENKDPDMILHFKDLDAIDEHIKRLLILKEMMEKKNADGQ